MSGGVPSGSENTKAAPPSGDVPASILPPCASTIGAADRQAQSDARLGGLALAARKFFEHRFLAPRRAGRAVIVNDDVDRSRRAAWPRSRCASRAAYIWRRFRAGCTVPVRSGRRRSAPAASRAATAVMTACWLSVRGAGAQCAADDFLQRVPLQVEFDLAALDARHVEQVGHQGAHAQRFLMQRACHVQLVRGQAAAASRASDSDSPTSEVSGVRRSCDRAASSELRRRSDSMLTSASCATSM